LVPVGKVVADPCFKVLDAVGDFVLRHGNRRHVEIAEVDSKVNAFGGWDHQMSGVVLAQAFDREFAADGLKWFEDGGPVLRIAEPEFFVFLCFQSILEDQIVRVDVFPTLGAFWHREFGRVWKRFHGHGKWPFRTSRTRRSWKKWRSLFLARPQTLRLCQRAWRLVSWTSEQFLDEIAVTECFRRLAGLHRSTIQCPAVCRSVSLRVLPVGRQRLAARRLGCELLVVPLPLRVRSGCWSQHLESTQRACRQCAR